MPCLAALLSPTGYSSIAERYCLYPLNQSPNVIRLYCVALFSNLAGTFYHQFPSALQKVESVFIELKQWDFHVR